MAQRWFVLSGLLVARLAFAFQLQSLAIVAPGLAESLGLDAWAIGTLVGLFMLPGIVLAIPGGWLAQRFGERHFLISCLAAMATGGLICGLADGYWPLWFGRLLAGFGAIGINVAMTKIVVDWFAGKEIATAMALFLSSYPAGIAIALVTLGHLATPERWRLAFFASAAFAALALIAFALTHRRIEGHASSSSVVLRPSRREALMTCLVGAIWAFYNAAYIVMVSFIPIYLVGQGLDAATAGALVGSGLWVAIVASPLGGALVDRFGRANLTIAGGILLWGLGLLLVLAWTHSVTLLALLFVVTALIGNLPPGPIVALLAEVVRPEVRGSVMGLFYTLLYGGIALGPMAAGYLSQREGPAAAVWLIAVLAVFAVLTLALFRLLQARGHCHKSDSNTGTWTIPSGPEK